MPDQKNLIIAIVLSVVILLAFQLLQEKPPVEEQVAEGQATTEGAPAAPEVDSPVVVPGEAGQPTVQSQSREAVLSQASRADIVTPRLKGSIALTGGRIDDLVLNDYHVTVDKGSPPVTLLSPSAGPNGYYAEFGWIVADNQDIKVPGPATEWRTDGATLRPDQPLVLRWDNGEGLVFTRIFAVDRDYMFTITQRVENRTDRAIELLPYGLIAREGTPDTLGFFILHEGPYGVFNGTLEEIDYDDVQDAPNARIAPPRSVGGWIGITDKYWLTALVPDQSQPFNGSFNYRPAKDKYQIDYLRPALSVPAGGEIEVTDRLFAGAKEVQLLDRYRDSLGIQRFDLAIDWGWFEFLTKPLFHSLDFFNKLVGNFGVAIIVLTIIIKFLFLPLAYKSYVSMSAMKRLQPEITKLRERFGEDRQRLNKEMMELYKREKVNPVSGCLPMILQIPVFFALYKVLFVTIEMRHQPFFGWIKDLSAPDPTTVFNLFGLIPWQPPFDFMLIGIWPLIMGLSMFLQQKLNPQPPDPVQARLFMFMPIIFTLLLARFPAGLVIYWTCNNVLSMAQQWLIMKRQGARAKAPAKT